MKLVTALLLVPSLALADVPPPAPIPSMPSNLPASPIMAMPGNGYTVLPADPEPPSSTRKTVGTVMIVAGIGVGVLGAVMLATRPTVPGLGAPNWFDAQSSYDSETAGGILLMTAGLTGALVGAMLHAVPEHSYGESPGAPSLTF